MSRVFSVIVPIYNVEQYLDRCVQSILHQTFTDFELILVDDGSPDHCPEMCDEYARNDPRVRVIHKPNGGLVSARNTGIKAAAGDYICYVDGDDWVDTHLLETVWSKAICTYQPDMVIFSAVKQFADRAEPIPIPVAEGLYDKHRLDRDIYPYMMYDHRKPFCTGLIFPVAWNKIFRRTLLLEHYCTEERIRMGEDNAFVFECLYAAETVCFCPESLYFYNQLNSGSMVHSYDPGRFENNQLLTSYLEARLGGRDPVLDEQINAFKAYWLIMAVFHEVKCGKPLNSSAAHIKGKIAQTGALSGIRTDTLPMTARIFLLLLKCRLYRTALFAAKIVNRLREQ